MSLFNQDSDIQINILSSEVSSLRAEITELKKMLLIMFLLKLSLSLNMDLIKVMQQHML